MSHLQAQWYYATRYVIAIVGFILYACGIVSLARRAKELRSPKA